MAGEGSPRVALPEEEPLDPKGFTTFQRLARNPDCRVVVSLGGGSVPGLCGNVALVRILEELDLRSRVDEVWGTSAGAAVGGPWATGRPAREILAHIMALQRKRALDVAWGRLLLGLLARPLGGRLPDGLVRGRVFSRTVASALMKPDFEGCEIPFRCIACSDDGQARTKVFRRGPLEPAIFSSMSLPGIVFPRGPQPGSRHGYYDGGLAEKTPLLSPIAEHLRSGRKERLVILGTHYGNDAKKTPARGFLNRFVQTIYALEDLAWHYQLKEARARPGVDLMILNPHIADPKLFDFSRVAPNYLHARQAYLDLLHNARLALSFGLA